jgi:hypothetical protein
MRLDLPVGVCARLPGWLRGEEGEEEDGESGGCYTGQALESKRARGGRTNFIEWTCRRITLCIRVDT